MESNHQAIMQALLPRLAAMPGEACVFGKDLTTGETSETGLPESNVLYFELENDAWCCVRPSGTEPKVKFYMGVKSKTMEQADKDLAELRKAMSLIADI